MKSLTHPFGETTDPQEGAACILAVFVPHRFRHSDAKTLCTNMTVPTANLHGVAWITKGKSRSQSPMLGNFFFFYFSFMHIFLAIYPTL